MEQSLQNQKPKRNLIRIIIAFVLIAGTWVLFTIWKIYFEYIYEKNKCWEAASISWINMVPDCEYNAAVALDSDLACDIFIREEWKNYSCHKNHAIEHNTINYCNKISSTETKNNCISKVASENNNYNFCLKISDSQKISDCLGVIGIRIWYKATTIADCKKIQQDSVLKWCYFELSKTLNDAKICELAWDFSWNSVDSCYYEIAKKTQNINLCQKTRKNEQKACLENLNIKEKNPMVCKNQLDATVLKDYCYSEQAKYKTDALICDNVSSSNEYDSCKRFIAIKTKDPLICLSIKDVKTKKECLWNMPDMWQKEENFCLNEKFSSQDRDFCYKAIALQKPDIALCLKILDDGERTDCLSFAIDQNINSDARNCLYVKDKTLIQKCLVRYFIKNKESISKIPDIKIINLSSEIKNDVFESSLQIKYTWEKKIRAYIDFYVYDDNVNYMKMINSFVDLEKNDVKTINGQHLINGYMEFTWRNNYLRATIFLDNSNDINVSEQKVIN